jgi:hypothetical protein
MGRKISTTYRRLSVPVLITNLETLGPTLPYELRNSCQDIYGWDCPTPIKIITKQGVRLAQQLSIQILQRLTNFLRAQGFQIVRLRLVDNVSHWVAHLFLFKSQILTIKTSRSLWLQLTNSFEKSQKSSTLIVTTRLLTASIAQWISIASVGK